MSRPLYAPPPLGGVVKVDDRILDSLNAWDTVFINKGVDMRKAVGLKEVSITSDPSKAAIGIFNLMADDWQRSIATFSAVPTIADFMIVGPAIVSLPESMHITCVEKFDNGQYLIKGKRVP